MPSPNYQTYGLPVAIARCGNVYGGGDLNWSRIVPEAIQAGMCVSRAYLRLAECMEDPRVLGQAFNFSPAHAISVLDLVARIQPLMGCEHLRPDVPNTAQGEIHSQYLDSSKAMRLLGWRPCFSLDEGLLETIAWYRDYLTQRKGTESARVSSTSGEQWWPGK